MASKKQKLDVISSMPVGDCIIDKLNQVIDRARSGELSMVAIATVERDGSPGRVWSFAHNTATILGAIELMKAEIIEQWMN